MTEDDTFAALKRAPFDTAVRNVAEKVGKPFGVVIWEFSNGWVIVKDENYFTRFTGGWTLSEFEKECKKLMV